MYLHVSLYWLDVRCVCAVSLCDVMGCINTLF